MTPLVFRISFKRNDGKWPRTMSSEVYESSSGYPAPRLGISWFCGSQGIMHLILFSFHLCRKKSNHKPKFLAPTWKGQWPKDKLLKWRTAFGKASTAFIVVKVLRRNRGGEEGEEVEKGRETSLFRLLTRLPCPELCYSPFDCVNNVTEEKLIPRM